MEEYHKRRKTMKKHGIEVIDLKKYFDDVQALKGVSFKIENPGLYGLIGPNGAGKTTLLKCISSLLVPTEGEVFINSDKVSIKNFKIRSRIGFLPEDSGLYDKLSAKEFLHIMAGMHGISKENRGKRVSEIVEYVGLNFSPSKIVKYLSSGQRRLLLFAGILLHDPDILILDESLSGLDPINREHITQIMRRVAKEKVVLFSSHILSDIWRLCERILILKEGDLIVDDKPDRLLAEVSDNSYFITPKAELEGLRSFMEKKWNFDYLQIQSDRIIFRFSDSDKIQSILTEIMNEYEIISFGPNIPDLDQIFNRLVTAS